ncbi:MAG: ubiquinone/menaquinone biosynthesis C-methylase UbiE [Chlamydiales bacterium]|jgi:ubiquinone/menaquinone biosynthesis C-methylase UbiE
MLSGEQRVIQKRRDWNEQALAKDGFCQQVCRQVTKEDFSKVIEDISWKLELPGGGHSLLDVGCGNGYLLQHLQKHCSFVSGSDFSEEMVRKARCNIPLGDFICGEALNIGYRENSFERVLIYSVFHYFPDQSYAKRVIKEAVRVCQSGGKVLLGDLLDKREEERIKGSSDLEYEKTIPLIQRYSSWLFLDLEEILSFIRALGCDCEILPQAKEWPLSSYRKDIKIWV